MARRRQGNAHWSPDLRPRRNPRLLHPARRAGTAIIGRVGDRFRRRRPSADLCLPPPLPIASRSRGAPLSPHRIYITESTYRDLMDAYRHIGWDDDEYAVPAYTIAESTIFVDCAPLPEMHQRRGMLSVVASGEGVGAQLTCMNENYGGRVRLSITHCHQFGGLPSLSSVDLDGFRCVLENPLTSKPFAHGDRIPVLLISGSGVERRLLGFMVTREGFERAPVIRIPEDDPQVVAAWRRAPVALPDAQKAKLLERAERGMGTEWTVQLVRHPTSEHFAFRCLHTLGGALLLQFGDAFPLGRPTLHTRSATALDPALPWKALDLHGLVDEAAARTGRPAELRLEGTPDGFPRVCLADDRIDDELCYLDHLRWSALGGLQ